ncbi:murein endopeptidase [Shewanella psychrophila]|uniref:Murein endopeptidase n=1 Tax=Shewanella psychrophila TaxID=225848 RepID=A0A1S6HRL0_9GAMM|nr:penicillin-insensitive murein endopeptidase [Shewanella psychrophila]AQS38155.1 murein endopeptidase [Shewanella psychrophila]
MNKGWLILFQLLPLFVPLQAIANVWSEMKTPYPVTNDQPDGEVPFVTKIGSLAIGSYANGCLAGADTLPLEGKGYQVIRTSRNRYYGHPELISFVQEFAKQLNQSEGDDLLIGDISMPRGGNFVSGHASHQIGLDVDIWFRQAAKLQTLEQRESPEELSLVDTNSFEVNDNWQALHGKMIRLAAENPQVARVFVNPAIKQKLCEQAQGDIDSSHHWLSKVRPWWGHKIHMHVRLSCPDGDKLCQNQNPPKSGTGCGDLSWWKQQILQLKKSAQTSKDKKKEPKPVKVKPKQCAQLLQ